VAGLGRDPLHRDGRPADHRLRPDSLDRELTPTQDGLHAAAPQTAARRRLAGGPGVGLSKSGARDEPFALNIGEGMTVDSYRDDRLTAR
jgi:hypothetical protein